jgi:hypothetical protein
MATPTVIKAIKSLCTGLKAPSSDVSELTGWNHRVILTEQANGSRLLAIYEVHYDGDGRPLDFGAEPVIIDGETSTELAHMLASMKRALVLPVLKFSDFPAAEPIAIEGRDDVIQLAQDFVSARIQ